MNNMGRLAELCFLDVSYCKQFTDAGFAGFKDKSYQLDSLIINGCNGISGPGLKEWLHSFKDTLLDLEAAFNDQESFSSAFFETLGYCFNLETLDVVGSANIVDEDVRKMVAAGVTVGNETIHPGLQHCHTLKISCTAIGDATIPMIVKAMPSLEHLEMARCENMGEFGIKEVI